MDKIVSSPCSSKASHLSIQREQRRALSVVPDNTGNPVRTTECIGDHDTPYSSIDIKFSPIRGLIKFPEEAWPARSLHIAKYMEVES